MTTLHYLNDDIDRAIARLPRITIDTPEAREVAAGTPEAREIAAIRDPLLIAKARIATVMQRRPDPAGSTDAWGR